MNSGTVLIGGLPLRGPYRPTVRLRCGARPRARPRDQATARWSQICGAAKEVDRERDGPAMLTPEDGEIERAISSVAGVASASLRRDPGTGRTRLRLKLKPGEDAEQATWAVAATLRERFGIALDPDAIRPVATFDEAADIPQGEAAAAEEEAAAASFGRAEEVVATEAATAEEVAAAPDPGAEAVTAAEELESPIGQSVGVTPPPAAATPPPPPPIPSATAAPGAGGAGAGTRSGRDRVERVPRATITRFDVQRGDHRVQVTVGLRQGASTAEGVARAAPTVRSEQRAIAEATASALQQLTAAPLLIAVDRVDVEPAANPARALVTLTLMADRGEEELIGVSLVRGQPERAVVRATLDACNRRLESFLDATSAGPLAPAI